MVGRLELLSSGKFEAIRCVITWYLEASLNYSHRKGKEKPNSWHKKPPVFSMSAQQQNNLIYTKIVIPLQTWEKIEKLRKPDSTLTKCLQFSRQCGLHWVIFTENLWTNFNLCWYLLYSSTSSWFVVWSKMSRFHVRIVCELGSQVLSFSHVWPFEWNNNWIKNLRELSQTRKRLPLNLRGIEKRVFEVVFLFFPFLFRSSSFFSIFY